MATENELYEPADAIENDVRESVVAWIDRTTDWDVHDDEKPQTEDISRGLAQAIVIDLTAAGWKVVRP